MPQLRLASLLLAAAVLVSACISGGGSGSRDRCVGRALFGCLAAPQLSLGRIRAGTAWRRIAKKEGGLPNPGDGQTVGLVDSGIDKDHPAFCGGSAPCNKTVAEELIGGAADETGTECSHGTAVASILAGRLEGALGVAWGADIAMISFDPGIAVPDSYTPVMLARFGILDGTFKPVIDCVLAWSSGVRSLDFVNLSLGVNGIIDQHSAADSPPCCTWSAAHRR